MTRPPFLAAGLALSLPTLALSSAALADPTMECDGGSQIEIGACVTATLAAVDRSLETALGFARISAEELDNATGFGTAVPALDAAQEAWSAYRDAHCHAVGEGFGGGSGTGIAITACRVTLGRARVEELLNSVH
ncbi:MAG: DUF1311 domain-containing protein [Proteobacteria bacterium]|nr:DUF1311 domain-containing protein [Pseudomonadota bacterium]